MATDKTVIIGATGGIGSLLAQTLFSEGAALHLIARTEEPLASLAKELGASFSALDASNFDALEQALAVIHNQGDTVKAVVNCAGSLFLKPAHLTSQAEFEDTITRNLTTAFSTVRAAGKLMQEGDVVLCSTAAVRIGFHNHEAIAAAKGGIEALVRSAAATYATRGLRINAIAPGLTRTPMTKRIHENERSLAVSTSMHALGRIGESADIVSAIRWLLDSSQTWVTGQTIAIDGGLSSVHAAASTGR